MTFQEKLEQIKREGYSFSVSDVVSNSVNLVTKKLLWFSIGFILIVGIISSVIGSIANIFADTSPYSQGLLIEEPSLDNMMKFYAAYFTPLVTVITIIASLVSYSLYYSYIYIAKKADLGEEYSMSDMFLIIKSSRVWGFIGLYLMIMIMIGIGSVLCVLPGIYLAVATSLAIPIYLFNDNMSPMDAIKASISTVNKKFFTILWAQVLLGLISIVGVIACCIGLLATYNILYAGQYFIYKEIFGIESKKIFDIDEIGQAETY
ncbi:MAG: hypothetical protein ACK5L5_06125 [Bacteroidales bacterium]